MTLGGYTGRILKVNLTTRTSTIEEPNEIDYRNFIGSRGLGAYLLSQTRQPETHPLSPENPLILITGPLTQTNLLSTPKYAAVAKSPQTFLYTTSLASGKFGLNLKSCGYDGIFLTGKSDSPTVLSLDEEGVRFHGAHWLWGKKTSQTIKDLRERFGHVMEVLCIGPAGEKLVPLSCAFSGARTHGRRGHRSRDRFQES